MEGSTLNPDGESSKNNPVRLCRTYQVMYFPTHTVAYSYMRSQIARDKFNCANNSRCLFIEMWAKASQDGRQSLIDFLSVLSFPPSSFLFVLR